MKALARDLALVNGRREHGVMGSYPAWLPFGILRLPIDHLLASRDFTVIGARLGPDIGSDHLPLVTTLAWRG